MKEYNVVGKSVRRLDAAEKATGFNTFATDISLLGMLYGKVLRSPHPHAKIVSIDTSEAEKLPGVKAVATYKNCPRNIFNTAATAYFTVPPLVPVYDQYIFDNVVRYVGDEVAAVAAVSEKVAEEALKLIKVEYELLPTVYDPLEAMKPEAPVIHETREGKNIPGELVKIPFGDIEKGMAESDIVVEETVKVPVQKQCQMETMAAVAQVSVNGNITVWSTTQTPHPTKMILSRIFKIPESKIRVLNPPYIGGGFGVRIGCSAKAEPIAVLLSMLAKKPVKMVYTRKEDFIASDTRHGGYLTIKLGAKKDGTFHALDLKATLNTGAYCSWGAEVMGVLGATALEVYRIPHQNYVGHSVYTNTTPAGAMRGFGNPQGIFAVETAVSIMAEKLGMDPVELRLKNIIKPGDKWPLPYECSTSGLDVCLTEGAKRIGWENRGKLNKPGSKKLRGIGVSVGSHCSNSWPWCVDYNNAYVTIQQDGSVHVATGIVDMGTGTTTVLPQMVAETLGAKFEEVNITIADSAATPFEIGSHASRTCYSSGICVTEAANHAKKQLFEYAAKMLEVPVDTIEAKDSVIYVKGSDKTITFEKVAYDAHLHNKQFIGVGSTIPNNAPPFHAHFVEVEVDTETGQVHVIKVVAAHDVGKAIHPISVEGQIQGGILQGLGYALTEEICYNNKGKQLQDGYHKYMLATAEDVPEMEVILVETNDPTHPYGVKGVGECGMVPTAPAVAAAVHDALGIRFTEIPMTQEKVFAALQKK